MLSIRGISPDGDHFLMVLLRGKVLSRHVAGVAIVQYVSGLLLIDYQVI